MDLLEQYFRSIDRYDFFGYRVIGRNIRIGYTTFTDGTVKDILKKFSSGISKFRFNWGDRLLIIILDSVSPDFFEILSTGILTYEKIRDYNGDDDLHKSICVWILEEE